MKVNITDFVRLLIQSRLPMPRDQFCLKCGFLDSFGQIRPRNLHEETKLGG